MPVIAVIPTTPEITREFDCAQWDALKAGHGFTLIKRDCVGEDPIVRRPYAEVRRRKRAITYNQTGGAIQGELPIYVTSNLGVTTVSFLEGTNAGDVLTWDGDSWESVAPAGDEQFQDSIGGILTDTDTIDFTYDDATPSITADVRLQMSVTSDASGIKLDGDSASPGASKYYGTNGSSTKGWHDLPTGGGTVNGSGTASRVAYWTASDTIAADDDFQFDGSGVGVGTGTMTGKFNVDAGSGFAQLPVNAYAAGSSVVYAQVSNTTTNAETWLSLNQEANINTIRGGLRRYGSTHGTFPNVIDLVNTQNAALRFITNNNIRLTISNAGAFTVTSVAGTGDRLIQADANGTLARSTIDPATLVAYTFTNGLTNTSGTVKLGGTLTDATTTVNHNSNALRFYGGKFVIGGNSNYSPQTTVVGTSLTGSNLASVCLHVAASGGDNNAKLSLGVGDAYSAGVGYFFTDQITRLYNMSAGGTLRLGIGGETSDKVVLQNSNTIGRLGVGFANTTGMHSTLQSAGSFAAKVRDPGTTNYTITETDFIVARLTGTASPTWTLPSPTGLDGRMYILHNRGTGTVTLSASVSSNNGTTFNTLPASNFAIIYATNSTWYGIRLTSI